MIFEMREEFLFTLSSSVFPGRGTIRLTYRYEVVLLLFLIHFNL